MSSCRGFTRAEFIISLVIVLILAAFLFPFFAHSREGWPHWTCASNEDQLGLAMIQYAQDNNQRLPSGPGRNGVGWAGAFYPYIKAPLIYQCPKDHLKAQPPRVVVSYGLNNNLLNRNFAGLPAPSHTVALFEISGDTAEVTRPDEGRSAGLTTFSAAGDGVDGTLHGGTAPVAYATGKLGNRMDLRPAQESAPRHHGGSNYLLADGHVKYFLGSQVSSGANARHPGDPQMGFVSGQAAGTGNTRYSATFSGV